MKKAVKISVIVIGSIIGLLLVASLLAPPIAKNYVEKHDKELIGRELSIGRIGANLFLGSAKVKDLTLFEDDDTTAFVSFDHLKLKIKLLDLFKHRVFVKHATVSGLKANVEQNRDWFNFNSLLDFLASDEPKTEKSSPYSLILNNIRIENSQFSYADLALGSTFLLRDIALFIPSLDLSDLKTDVGLDLALSDEATLHTDLRLSDNGKKYFINLKASNLGVEIIEPYLQKNYPIDLRNGLAHLDLEINGLTEHILDFDLKGDILLHNLDLQDTEGHPLCTVDSTLAIITRFNLENKDLHFDKLAFSGLKTAYIVDADSISNFHLVWESYRHRDDADEETTNDSISAENEDDTSWKIHIAELSLKNGCLAYEDHTIPEVFLYEIGDISFNSKHFDWKGNNTVQMRAALNKVGKLNLNWQGCFRGRDNHNLTLMLSNVKMADFSPYAVQFFGFPIESGTLSFRSQNIIKNDNINGINKLQIASAVVGNKVKTVQPRFSKVPLKLSLYLLADKQGNASLDLPVSGSLNDPDFSYGKAIGKVFSNVLSKVAASPFRLMTDDDNNLKYIPFDPLKFDFTSTQYEMIDNMVITLQSRSDLAIVLEEQVQYDETIKQLCIKQLQRDYYLSLHPEMKSSDIDFITNEAIQSIKLNDKGLCDFAKQYSEKKRLRSAKDVESVACAVYQEKSEKLLLKLIEKQREMMEDYLMNVKGLSPEQVSVTTIDKSLMKTFSKTSRFEMHVFRYEDME